MIPLSTSNVFVKMFPDEIVKTPSEPDTDVAEIKFKTEDIERYVVSRCAEVSKGLVNTMITSLGIDCESDQ